MELIPIFNIDDFTEDEWKLLNEAEIIQQYGLNPHYVGSYFEEADEFDVKFINRYVRTSEFRHELKDGYVKKILHIDDMFREKLKGISLNTNLIYIEL